MSIFKKTNFDSYFRVFFPEKRMIARQDLAVEDGIVGFGSQLGHGSSDLARFVQVDLALFEHLARARHHTAAVDENVAVLLLGSAARIRIACVRTKQKQHERMTARSAAAIALTVNAIVIASTTFFFL